MKKILSILCLVTLIGTSSLANANEKIAIVDMKNVAESSTAANSLRAQLNKKRNELQEKVTAKENELRNEERDLVQQRSLISKDAFEERSKAFQKKMIEAQQELQTEGAKLQRNFEKSMKTIQDEMLKIVESIAKDEGFTLVSPKANLLFSGNNADISSKVIDKLNNELDDITLE